MDAKQWWSNMLKNWWLLFCFSRWQIMKIQVCSVLKLQVHKRCRKKLARVTPSLYLWFGSTKIVYLHNCAITKWQVAKVCIAQSGTVPFCDCTIGHRRQSCTIVQSQNGKLPNCAITKLHIANLWLHKFVFSMCGQVCRSILKYRHQLHLFEGYGCSYQLSWLLHR